MSRMTYSQLLEENSKLRHNYEILEACLHQANLELARHIILPKDIGRVSAPINQSNQTRPTK